MSAVVRPAGEADIEPVAALLHERMNAKITPERWRHLLDYPWRPKGVERGWLVEDQGRIVGFMGTIYSDRPTGLGLRRFCDLSSWYLLADYRGDGTGDLLLRSGMAQPGVTYQTMTARRATGRKIRALGFSVLDATRSLFAPVCIERDVGPPLIALFAIPVGLAVPDHVERRKCLRRHCEAVVSEEGRGSVLRDVWRVDSLHADDMIAGIDMVHFAGHRARQV